MRQISFAQNGHSVKRDLDIFSFLITAIFDSYHLVDNNYSLIFLLHFTLLEKLASQMGHFFKFVSIFLHVLRYFKIQ